MNDRYTIVPTAGEWRTGLYLTRSRRSSLGADIVKTLILFFLVLYCWIPFFAQGMQDRQSFFVGLLSLILGIALWVVPAIALGIDAKKIAAGGQTIHLTVTDESLGFGEEAHCEWIAYNEIRAKGTEEVLALTFDGGSMLVLPRRALDEDAWQRICARLAQNEGD
ncbi:MAG: hypothetical protein J6K98_01350 [Clostridia bacterium]|nr:hypothetical protein [Clostridia bacterium]